MNTQEAAREQAWQATWNRCREIVTTNGRNPDDVALLLDALGMNGDCPRFMSLNPVPEPGKSQAPASANGWAFE